MYEYLEILEEFPAELRRSVVKLVGAIEDNLRRQIGVTKEDFTELRKAVERLTEAQERTEEELRRLSQAQVRTEERIRELSEAQARTEEELKKLAEAQNRFQRSFDSKIGALESRWGVYSERTFRNAMREMLGEVGFEVERYLRFDEEGAVFGRPDQVELDVVVKDGKLMILEIKSSLSWEEVYTFQKKVEFYESQEGKKADRKIIVAPFVEGERPFDLALKLGIEIFTSVDDLS